MWKASAVGLLMLLMLLLVVEGNIIVYTQDTPHTIMEEFRDMPADFGEDIPIEGLRGFLVLGVPRDGCSNMTKPPFDEVNFTGRWIVLIAKHNCSYETQVRNAQTAGFDAVIVHNVNSSELEVMTADDPDGISIPSVFVSDRAGLILAQDLYTSGYYIMVNSELPFDLNTHLLLPFAIVVVLCLLVILIFMIVKCIKDRRRARRHRLPNRALKKIPTCKFSKGDPYDTCAICLDDYQEGDRLRVLPCAHAYHSMCIDPWLTQNKRVCPVCKRRVFAAGEARRGAASDSSDDAEPLLAAPPRSQGGTFDEQRENPFARATRFMARLRARNNGEPEIPPSPPNDTEHMNSANVENGITEETAALLPAAASRRTNRSRRARARARTAPAPAPAPAPTSQHSINASGQGEIGVAALPASARHVNL